MFVVLLKFSRHRDQAKAHMDGHKAWVQQGFADKVFLLAGSIETGQGGAILVNKVPHAELQRRVNEDPFVQHGVVDAEIVEITPAMTDERLAFLKG